ncbi:unnamed protein product [Oikopleura dioica]|uniref:Major facilitator superfamily (MFS) profile domain-containing protein n=1 Tax=Oikopleura dioica TaxID=34765 RepID=E4Y0V6_OIKDI|nr:unnamed protein product [Oikopleura dioica]
MPILTDLWLLIIIVTITGIIAGYIDAAIQCIMLKVWGSKKSASILQLHHFTFSIGAFLAPLLVSPFYSGDDDICSDSTDDNNEPVCLGIGDNNSILTPFLISSAFIASVFILMIWLYFVDITEKIKEDNQESADEREEDSFRDLWQYFIPVILFYFCIVSGENVYQSNIFSYAACKVGWESGKASILNSIFWAGFGIGRGSGIFFSRFLRPSTYIIIDLIFCAATATFLSIYPTNEIMLWIGSFTYGLGIATLYSCGISYSHELTNVSGKWIVTFGIGNAIGAMSMPILGTGIG